MRHLFIPDTQVKQGVAIDHLEALGNYIVDKQPEVIVHIGDHFDMPSLSSYEKPGSKYFHDQSYSDDIESGLIGMETLLGPIERYNRKRKKQKLKKYKPRMIFCLGNHENRVDRAAYAQPVLEGTISKADFKLEESGWEVYPFLKIAEVDDILYSHYFVNTNSLMKNVIAGTVDNKLLKVGQSFSMGHQQQLQYGIRYLNNGRSIRGLVAGAFYQQDEVYLGEQGNHYWRGVIMKNEVHKGEYDPMFISINYLREKWL